MSDLLVSVSRRHSCRRGFWVLGTALTLSLTLPEIMAAQLRSNFKINSPVPCELANPNDPLSLVITNESDTPIEAMVIYWRYAAPGSTVLAGPATDIVHYYFPDSPAVLSAHSSGTFSMSLNINYDGPVVIDVDGILYTDGRLVGPDHFGLQHFIDDKWAVLRKISNDVVRFRGKHAQLAAHLKANYLDKEWEQKGPTWDHAESTWHQYLAEKTYAERMHDDVVTGNNTEAMWEFVDRHLHFKEKKGELK